MKGLFFKTSRRAAAVRSYAPALIETLESRRLLTQIASIDSPYVFDVPGVTDAVPSTNRVYASPTGSTGVTRTQASSASSPAELGHAVGIASAGDTVILQAGTYRTGDLDVQKQLNFRAAPGAEVWIKGSQDISPSTGRAWTQTTINSQPAWWTTWGFKFNHPANSQSELGGTGGDAAGHRDLTFLDGKPLRQVLSSGALQPGTFWIDTSNSRLYIADNPSGRLVEGSVRNRAIVIRTSNANGSTFRGIGVAQFTDTGLGVAAANVTVEDSAFVQNARNGLSISPGFGPTLSGTTPNNAIVRRNIMVSNGKLGFNSNNNTGLLATQNYLGYNNNEGFSGWAAGGMKFVKLSDARIYNNVVDRTYTRGSGIWFDVSSFRPWIVGNVVRNTQGSGIHIELSDGAVVAFNTVTGSANGTWVHDASNTYVFNNTFTGNVNNLYVYDSSRINDWNDNEGSTQGIGGKALNDYRAGATWVTRGTLARNNILSTQSTGNETTTSHIEASVIDTSQHLVPVTNTPRYPVTYPGSTGNTSASDSNTIGTSLTIPSPTTSNSQEMFATQFAPYLGWTVFDLGPSASVKWRAGSTVTNYTPSGFDTAYPNAMRASGNAVFKQTSGGLFKNPFKDDYRLASTSSPAFNFAAGLPTVVRDAAVAAGVYGISTSGNGFSNGNFSGALHPSAPTPRGPNLVPTNHDFSGGTTGWTFTNANYDSTTGSARALGNGGDVRRTVSGLTAGATYLLRARARVEANVGSLFVTNYGGGSGGNPATLSTAVRNTGTSLQSHSLTFRLGGGLTSAVIGFSKAGNGAGFVDDFELIRIA